MARDTDVNKLVHAAAAAHTHTHTHESNYAATTTTTNDANDADVAFWMQRDRGDCLGIE